MGYALNFEIEIDFFQGIGNILIDFDHDLLFHLCIGQAGRHGDDLGHNGRTGDSDTRLLDSRTRLLDGGFDGFADDFDIGDVFIDDGILRQGDYGITLDSVAPAGFAEFQ